MKKLFALAVAAVCAVGFSGRAEEKPAKSDQTICDVAMASKDHTTLVEAVKAAGLAETLKGEGPYTVFAPTNAAFEKIGKEKLEAVMKDKEKLTAILKAHVVKGSWKAADVLKLDGKEVETLDGSKFTIKIDGEKVKVGEANVTKADLACSNGVIHVIDTVLMPTSK